jgi:4-hydroxybenzoate polyprenyltransferase
VLLALVRELRPRQWIKNLACLAGLVFSGRLFLLEHVLHAAVGFLAFCCVSSAVYILNDYLDREKDRLDPRTAGRPLTAGLLPVWLAAVAFSLLMVLAAAGSVWLGTTCVVVLAVYFGMNVLYSTGLNQTVIADVMCIALGFVLRVMYGVYAVQDRPTGWIVLCMFFLALFLGFAKRKAELTTVREDAVLLRPVLREYGMGYLDLLLTMTASMTIMCYALFTAASHKNPTLIVTILPVVYCVSRYLHRVMLHGQGGSPEDVLFSDRMLWLGILTWLGLCILILYFEINLFAETEVWHRR